MKIKELELEAVAVKKSQYPRNELPEFAFVGRSNVGKSSFINAFLGRKNLARTSKKPGKTRTINFYKINNIFRLVDLPGYGYAATSKKEKNAWADIINEYLVEREHLSELILLVDMRHKPTVQDQQMYYWMVENNFAGLVIATKADKLSQPKRKKAMDRIKKTLNIQDSQLIIPYSSETGENLDEIEKIILDMCKHYS